jgi:hypothetical protein
MARFSARGRRPALGACTGIFVVALAGAAVLGPAAASAATRPGPRERTGQHERAGQHAVAAHTAASTRSALLTLSDLPKGWTESAGRATTSHGAAWSAPLARCVGVPAAVADARPVRMTSPNFTSGDKTLAVEDSVSVYETVAAARAQFAALDDKMTPACMDSVAARALQATAQSEAGDTATVGTVDIAALNPTVFPHDAGFTVSIPLVSGGRELIVRSTEVDFVTGRLDQQLTFDGNGAGFPAALALQLIEAARAAPSPARP